METLLGILIILAILFYAISWLISAIAPIIIGLLFVFLFSFSICCIYLVYQFFYFRTSSFLNVKNEIKVHADECNELNMHIEELKNAYLNVKKTDYGTALYIDKSLYNFKRPALKKAEQEQNIYDCSLSVCRNAQQQPFKYLCKYFNIDTDEETLENFEKVFNDFSAAEQGKCLLKQKKENIIHNFSSKIPFLIRKLSKKTLYKKLGFTDIDLSNLHFPIYCFRYISPGGNSSMESSIVFDIDTLERFIDYLSGIIKFRKSIEGQRALMTSQLREKIKARDKYTCQICGISTTEEPHLLLEIDHIIPLSRNGLTTESNLQTLCWKCNRSKGSKTL